MSRSALEETTDVLSTILAYGPQPANEVCRQAAQAGLARRTLHRAKAALGVRSEKIGYRWEWALKKPSAPSPAGEDCQNP